MSSMEHTRADVAMAVDIRGESVHMGIVSRAGEVLFSQRYPWETSSVAAFLDTLMRDMADFQRRTEGRWAYSRIGVGIGGWVNRDSGMWLYTKKVEGFEGPVPLQHLLERATGRQVTVDNDIHVSTLAENRFGIGRVYPNFAYYYIGRGIAAGVVSGGQLLRGAANRAGEYGYYLYDLNGAGGLCRLEDIASSRGMVRWARSLFAQYPGSALAEADRAGALTPAKIFECAAKNDPLAGYVAGHVQRGVGMSVVNLLSFTDSEAIVFGGEVLCEQAFLSALMDFIEEYCDPVALRSLNYIGSGRLDIHNEGIIGAALLTWEDAARP